MSNAGQTKLSEILKRADTDYDYDKVIEFTSELRAAVANRPSRVNMNPTRLADKVTDGTNVINATGLTFDKNKEEQVPSSQGTVEEVSSDEQEQLSQPVETSSDQKSQATAKHQGRKRTLLTLSFALTCTLSAGAWYLYETNAFTRTQQVAAIPSHEEEASVADRVSQVSKNIGTTASTAVLEQEGPATSGTEPSKPEEIFSERFAAADLKEGEKALDSVLHKSLQENIKRRDELAKASKILAQAKEENNKPEKLAPSEVVSLASKVTLRKIDEEKQPLVVTLASVEVPEEILKQPIADGQTTSDTVVAAKDEASPLGIPDINTLSDVLVHTPVEDQISVDKGQETAIKIITQTSAEKKLEEVASSPQETEIPPVTPGDELEETELVKLASIDDSLVSLNQACGEVGVEHLPVAGGLERYTITSGCHAGQVATVKYGEIAHQVSIDEKGAAVFVIDPFLGTLIQPEIVFSDGTKKILDMSPVDISGMTKVAVIWDGPIQVDLHAFEYSARLNSKGHIWRGTASSYEKAEELVKKTGRMHGFLTQMGADGAGKRAQIYTAFSSSLDDNDAELEAGVIRMALDYFPINNTGQDCTARPAIKADFTVFVLKGDGSNSQRRITRDVNACAGLNSVVSRLNPEIVSDIRLSAR